jgi:hypothetical protein
MIRAMQGDAYHELRRASVRRLEVILASDDEQAISTVVSTIGTLYDRVLATPRPSRWQIRHQDGTVSEVCPRQRTRTLTHAH